MSLVLTGIMMTKTFLTIVTIFFLLIPSVVNPNPNPQVDVYVTYSTCATCPEDPLQEKFEDYLWELYSLWGNNVQVRKIDIEPEIERDLDELYKNWGVPDYIPTKFTLVVSIDEKYIFVNHIPVEIINDFLSNHSLEFRKIIVYNDETRGVYKIIDDVGNIIECEIENAISEFPCKTSKSFLNWPTLSLLVISGVLDGINPCAFAVMLFMITLFFTREVTVESPRKHKNMVLLFGSTYILAVYLTYLSIGLTLRKVIDTIPFPHMISKIGSIVLIIAGIIKLINHFWPGRGISLKLSKSARLKIATVKVSTLPSTFAIGVLVALFEFPCTGGIYVAILSILATKSTFLRGIIYLLIYNFAFILPLIAILIISTNTGLTIFSLRKWQQKGRKQMELLESLIYISLGLVLLFISFV